MTVERAHNDVLYITIESQTPFGLTAIARPLIYKGELKRDVPVLHTGLISCSTGTSIPPKVENPGSTSVDGSRD
jgi:hypothetical protein